MASMARSPLLRQLAFGAPTKRFVHANARSLSGSTMHTESKALTPCARPLAQQISLLKSTPMTTCVAAFHTTSRRNILPALPQKLNGTANEASPVPKPDSMHGAYHWTFERVVSAALIPVTIAPFAGASMYPLADAVFAGLIIIHTHIGFQSVITDYLPRQRIPKTRMFVDWVLRLGSLVVAYGFYEFETNDVGLVEGVRRLWHA